MLAQYGVIEDDVPVLKNTGRVCQCRR